MLREIGERGQKVEKQKGSWHQTRQILNQIQNIDFIYTYLFLYTLMYTHTVYILNI